MDFLGIKLEGRIVLAPMAGVTDSPFRILARRCGAAMVYTELASSEAMMRDSARTRRLMEFLPEERPIGIQIFGANPEAMAAAAAEAESLNPDLVDINFGCPAKKVVRGGGGAAVLQDLDLFRRIVAKVTGRVSLPVTLKIRSGWDSGSIVAVEAARIAEGEGARAVAVHARTRSMGFGGRADWDIIRRVRESVGIPVIGNGDVREPADAAGMLERTGCDLVMIGRGALGRPWLLSAAQHYIDSGESKDEPLHEERIRICLEHYDLALHLNGERRAVLEMRKHIGWYLKGMPGASRVKQAVFHETDPGKVREMLGGYRAGLSLSSRAIDGYPNPEL
jgi:nifR3 family TIM-barrel protein